MPNTSLGFPQPIIGSNNWGTPTNQGWALLNQFLSGIAAIPGLNITGDLTVAGTITAGSFAGLDGTFLTSSIFNVPNGIPQLNTLTKIPAYLLATEGIQVVAFSASPYFNAANTGQFKMTLTGDVTSSVLQAMSSINLLTFRIVQDGTGGHAFTWPPNVRNAGAVNPGPNSRSIQVFAQDSDGSFDAASPMMYS